MQECPYCAKLTRVFLRDDDGSIHMTCLWCDKKLRFFRALTGSRYCCDKHRSEDRAHIKQLVIGRFETYLSREHAKQKPDTLLLPLEPSSPFVSTIDTLLPDREYEHEPQI
jgi:hypothetical protein